MSSTFVKEIVNELSNEIYEFKLRQYLKNGITKKTSIT